MTKELLVSNKLGMHARPAAMFVKTANRFHCDIFVEKDGEKVNGKSIMGLMMLAAGAGSRITLHATGQDASQALSELETLSTQVRRGLMPMAHVEIDVKYVAHLARLWLTHEEEQSIGTQLGSVLDYIEKLKEVDVTGIEPTAHAFPMVNVTRPDEVRPGMSHEDALRNAPAEASGLFIVPKIVE